MMVPAFAIAIGEAFHLALSPALPLRRSLPTSSVPVVLFVQLVSRQALVRLPQSAIRLRRDEARAI